MLSQHEVLRYSRQMMIAELGEEGQGKLKRAQVIVAGVGGLGSVASIYLASVGVGKLRIVDHDKIALSDLNRQVLYSDSDIGKVKVGVAKQRLESLNPAVQVEAISEVVTQGNVSDLVSDCDLIIDGMDNLPSRYVLNAAAVEGKIPLCHGAVYGFGGQATTVIPGKTPCLRCLYNETVHEDDIPVLGTSPAIIGCIQATESIKYILGSGELLLGRLLIYDGLSSRFREVVVSREPNCEVCHHLP